MRLQAILPPAVSVLIGCALLANAQAQAPQKQLSADERLVSEAVWGDALQMHKAIAGEKNGGVGGGVSPKTALAVGLKVDTEALPAEPLQARAEMNRKMPSSSSI